MASVGLYVSEKNVNPRCNSLFDGFWLNVVFFLSGFEDYGPTTVTGKVLSFFSFVLGIGTIAVVTGKIASTFVITAQKGHKMPSNLSKHITICNWHVGGEKIIKEIHAPQAEPDVEIIVISKADINEEQLRKHIEFEKVFFIKSDPTLHSVLLSTRIYEARSIIILADSSSPDPDANTALIALAISKICSQKENKPHIVAEAINHRKIEHLKDAGVTEIVCGEDYEYGIIAQCAIYGKLSDVYQQLLTYSADTNEFYIIPSERVPLQLYGQTFDQISVLLSKSRATKNPLILVGMVKDSKAILNPRLEGPGSIPNLVFEKGDGLIVMAYDHPDLSFL